MAYYGGFPATYQPMIYQPQQPTQQNNGIIWVSGEAGAKAYMVAPNNTVQLWDSEGQTIYLKSADASGMPSIRVLDYTIRESASNVASSPVISSKVDLSDYVTKSEIKAFADQIAALKSKVDSFTKKRTKLIVEDDDDE